MTLMALATSPLTWVRIVALLFTCVAFSTSPHGAFSYISSTIGWCIFCWAFSFACTLLVLIVELFGLQARAPVSWTNFPITVACYAALLCLTASILYPWSFFWDTLPPSIRDRCIVSTFFSCLATLAYMGEVSLSKARPAEVTGYMATVPGLLKVCQTFVACVIFAFVSNPVLYNHHPALKWCMAVYCLCFIFSMAVVVLCVGEWTGLLPIPFSMFLSTHSLLAAAMYLTATIIWPVFQSDSFYHPIHAVKSNLITVTVLTVVNFLFYAADLAYTARLVFVT